jgi:pSer/pThr/pTyr-binding forkhead associated (FHA) protein
MTELGKTKKMCPNGHVMDPAWDVCPYCPSDRRAGPELARTVKVDDLAPPPPPPKPAPRKTEIIDNTVKIGGLGFLISLKTPNQGQTHRVDRDRMTVGAKADCDIVIDGNHVSDRHASVRFRDGGFYLTDLDSTNGTFVGGERVEQRPLKDGDAVRFGTSEWVFKCVTFEK